MKLSPATGLVCAWRLLRCASFCRQSRGALCGVYLGAVAGHQQLRNQPGPAGLMRSAHTPAAVAVEILVEEKVVAEVRISERALVHAVHRPMALFVAEEQTRKAPGELIGYLVERAESP